MSQNELSRLDVSLKERTYPIFIGSDFLQQIGSLIEPYTRSKKVFLITDSTVEMLYLPLIQASLEDAGYEFYVLTIDPGEGSKTLTQASILLDKILKIGCDRQTTLISFGGGVVGDLTGFCASVLLRGIDFIQIPTTLLAQTDSSVGGKTGVNMSSGKNLIGTFHQPKAVFIDVYTLKTLDPPQVLSGFGEVAKYGLGLNADFWHWLEKNGERVVALDADACRYAVEQCCRIKAAVVAADEFETTGLRSLLNLGHTFAHAIEGIGGMHGSILHGHAVAIGCVLASWLAADMQLCSSDLPQKVSDMFQKWGLPTQFDATLKTSELIAFMRKDKKATGHSLNFVLPEEIGSCVLVNDVPEVAVEDVFKLRGKKSNGFSFYGN